MEVRIRFATIKHLREIQDLNHQLCIKENREYDTTINHYYPLQKRGEDYFKARIKSGCALVAVENNIIIGYLVGEISPAEEYRTISKLA